MYLLLQTSPRIALACLAFVLTAVIAGCGSNNDVPPAAIVPPKPSHAPKDKIAQGDPAAQPKTKTVVAYSPPYPNRDNLFTPPKRAKSVARKTEGEYDDAVELIGFVAVDEPKAVLSIDGVVTSLAAGGKKYGIEVVSINPPQVVLQRGRNRWTTALD